MPVHTEAAAQLADDPAGFLSLGAFYTATGPNDLQSLLGQRTAVFVDSGTQSNAKILQTLLIFDPLDGEILHSKSNLVHDITLNAAPLVKGKHNSLCILIPIRMAAQQFEQPCFFLCPCVQICHNTGLTKGFFILIHDLIKGLF